MKMSKGDTCWKEVHKPTKRMCWTLMEQNLSSEISS